MAQEVLLHWVAKRRHYTADRGASMETFFRTVAKNLLADIYAEQKAAKRGSGSTPLSLDQPVHQRENDAAVYGDFIPDPRDIASEVEGKVERELLLGSLTPRQRDLVLWFEQGYKLAEVAQKMRIARTTLNDELNRVRKLFRQHDCGSTPT